MSSPDFSPASSARHSSPWRASAIHASSRSRTTVLCVSIEMRHSWIDARTLWPACGSSTDERSSIAADSGATRSSVRWCASVACSRGPRGQVQQRRAHAIRLAELEVGRPEHRDHARVDVRGRRLAAVVVQRRPQVGQRRQLQPGLLDQLAQPRARDLDLARAVVEHLALGRARPARRGRRARPPRSSRRRPDARAPRDTSRARAPPRRRRPAASGRFTAAATASTNAVGNSPGASGVGTDDGDYARQPERSNP